MRKEHKLHIPAALLIFGKKKVGRAALLWKISTRFVFNGKRRRILVYTLTYVMSTDQPKKHCDTRQSRQSVL